MSTTEALSSPRKRSFVSTLMSEWIALSRGTRFQVLFYAMVFVVGVFFVAGEPLLTDPYSKNILFGIGIALVSSAVIGFAQRLFFFDDFRAEMTGLVEGSLQDYLKTSMMPFIDDGLDRLYSSRSAAIKAFLAHLQSENQEIVIIGSSLKGLLDPNCEDKQKNEIATILRQTVKDGVSVRFLLTHPALAFLREKGEGRNAGDIKKEIIRTLRFLVGNEYSDRADKVAINVPLENIRLYHGTPTIFCVFASNHI